MVEGFIVMVLTVVVLTVVGGAVLVGVAVSRRSTRQWQEHLRQQAEQWSAESSASAGSGHLPVEPQQASLEELLAQESRKSSAYIDPQTLPGVNRLESVAHRVGGKTDPATRDHTS